MTILDDHLIIAVKMDAISPDIDIQGSCTIKDDNIEYGSEFTVDIEINTKNDAALKSGLNVDTVLPKGFEPSEINKGAWQEVGSIFSRHMSVIIKHREGMGTFKVFTKLYHEELGIELTVLDPFMGMDIEIDKPIISTMEIKIDNKVLSKDNPNILLLPIKSVLEGNFTYPSQKKERFTITPVLRFKIMGCLPQ